MSGDPILSGKRIAKVCYRPHPVHEALLLDIGAEMVEGRLMAWAKSDSMLRRRLYSRLSAILAPVEARRFRNRFDYLVVAPYSLPLGYWIKRWSPQTRLILMNSDPFFWRYQRLGTLARRYFDLYLSGVEGVLSGSALVDGLARRALDVPSRVFHPFFDASYFGDINGQARDMMVIAWLLPHKGVVKALDVYADLAQRLPVGRLHIAGDGPQRPEIEAKARRTAGAEVLGALDAPAIRRYLQQSLILLHLADFDPWAVVVYEAAAAGVIPIVTDQVGACDFLPRELVVSSANWRAEAAAVATRVFDMDAAARDALRRELQQIARRFTQQPCTVEFRRSFADLVADIERQRSGRR